MASIVMAICHQMAMRSSIYFEQLRRQSPLKQQVMKYAVIHANIESVAKAQDLRQFSQ
ncbi:hypothetical protein ACI2KS_07555 [Pseudomonas sp. NPDC087358]|uniref:hypothetical protein n=1 Tax=Pseudomonas sp. NPDC087358 TaxID=3364439 RepID=UPI00384D1181